MYRKDAILAPGCFLGGGLLDTTAEIIDLDVSLNRQLGTTYKCSKANKFSSGMRFTPFNN